MSPPCVHSNNIYLDYKCYTRLKKYFDVYGISREKSDIFDEIIKSANIPTNNNQSNNKILQDLEKHLKGYGVFLSENEDECCKYVNFWLNKEIKKNHYPLYNNTKFHIFQDFVKHFNYIEHNKNSKRCLSNINLIDPKIFEKMSKLYELYEFLADLKAPFSRMRQYTRCEIFGHIIGNHNRALADYQTLDPYLTERLIDLKKLIENANIEIKEQCYYKTSQLHKSQLEIDRDNAEIQRQNELRMKEEETRRQQEITRRKLEEATREAEQRRSTLLPSGNDVLGIIDAQESPGTNEIQKLEDYMHPKFGQYMETSQGIKDFANHLSVQPQEENELPISSPDSPERKWNSITDTQGTMGKITGVITGVLGEVEPAPILGVSGGMCALFLLFKYTPVGSFFGGRRGRNLRIPSGFPGAYPGFPEYYDGNFGIMPINISYQAE
ncbi:VIR protein [Plasmodium vivax]|uniref:VIR protein n=1 Tax=Plasmodium vivax TaxID=5855 RepID=A0A1G4EBE2_PLAVI|nr:VIR protein [Plasmodium vivax]